jgi:hypothetical protein
VLTRSTNAQSNLVPSADGAGLTLLDGHQAFPQLTPWPSRPSRSIGTQKWLEIAVETAQDRLMDQDHINAPEGWKEALARSEAELARGELVPSQAMHDELRQALAELEAELAKPVGPTHRRVRSR